MRAMATMKKSLLSRGLSFVQKAHKNHHKAHHAHHHKHHLKHHKHHSKHHHKRHHKRHHRSHYKKHFTSALQLEERNKTEGPPMVNVSVGPVDAEKQQRKCTINNSPSCQ